MNTDSGINIEMLKELARKMNVEYVDLKRVSVNKHALDALCVEVARKYQVFPFNISDNYLYLAMLNPDDIFAIDEIKVFTQKEIKPFLAEATLIEKAINTYYLQSEQDTKQATNQSHQKFSLTQTGTIKGKSKAEDVMKTGIFSPGKMDTEDMIRTIIMSGLKIENVVDVHIDTVNRNIIVTLSLHY